MIKYLVKTTICAVFVLFGASKTSAQDAIAFRIFDAGGKEVKFARALDVLGKADVVFFGEQHNDPISHWMELQLLKGLYEKHPDMALAMEMFESDDQLPLSEYLNGIIEERHLLKEAKVWDNYATDYKPLVEFAKGKGLPVIATNVPRRYANLVYRKGIESLDSLPANAKDLMAPLPVTIDLELPCYKNMIASMGGHASAGSAVNMAKSQALKDATMAYFIYRNLNRKILHVNGAYHSEKGEGIIWHLRQLKPGLSIATIQVVEQQKVDVLEEKNKKLGDFVIVVPEDMTKTY
jgi:uncharacterized iron-regulated protein